jgi:SPP1 gp7 family putative phage head morphogenesis protein
MLVFKARPRRDPAERPSLTPSERRVMALMRKARGEVIKDIQNRRGEFLYSLMHYSAAKTAGMIATQPWFDLQAELQSELLVEVVDGGRRVKLEPIQKATVRFRFDAERREAAAWAAKEAGQLIQGITQEQLTFVQELISQAELGAYTPANAAKTLRDMENGLGLTMQQAEWVQNFEARRITELMDQGFGYEAAVARAQGATARYADRIYRYRTETIARTEILRASNEGRNQAWQQGIDEGFINPQQEKEWSVNADDRLCDICAPLDGQRVLVTAEWPWGDPPIHPNCRCTVLLTDDIPEGLAALSLDELETEIDRLLGL